MQLMEILENRLEIGKFQKRGFVFDHDALLWAIKVKKNPLNQNNKSYLIVDVVNDCNIGLTNQNLTNLPCAFNIVEGDFYVDSNKLKSFSNFPSEIGGLLDLNQNQFTSLRDIAKSIKKCTKIDLGRNPIEEGGIGLLLIQGLKEIHAPRSGDFTKAAVIISKYLGRGKSAILECQEELEEAGLGRYAKI